MTSSLKLPRDAKNGPYSRGEVTNSTFLKMSWDERLVAESGVADMDILYECLAHKANPKFSDADGKTALMQSIFHQHTELTDLLLPLSDLKAQDYRGMSALMIAIRRQPHNVALIEKMLPASKPKAVNKEGKTALMLAASSGHESLIRLLLPVSNIHAKDKDGLTAATYASLQSDFSEGFRLALIIEPNNASILDAQQEYQNRSLKSVNTASVSQASSSATDSATDRRGIPSGEIPSLPLPEPQSAPQSIDMKAQLKKMRAPRQLAVAKNILESSPASSKKTKATQKR